MIPEEIRHGIFSGSVSCIYATVVEENSSSVDLLSSQHCSLAIETPRSDMAISLNEALSLATLSICERAVFLPS